MNPFFDLYISKFSLENSLSSLTTKYLNQTSWDYFHHFLTRACQVYHDATFSKSAMWGNYGVPHRFPSGYHLKLKSFRIQSKFNFFFGLRVSKQLKQCENSSESSPYSISETTSKRNWNLPFLHLDRPSDFWVDK